MFGLLLKFIHSFHYQELFEIYNSELTSISLNILADTRPGYGRERFVLFLQNIVQVFPNLLSINSNIFFKCTELVLLVKERSSILQLLSDFLQSPFSQSQLSEIIMTLHAAVDKLVYDSTSHEYFLEILNQLTSNRFL